MRILKIKTQHITHGKTKIHRVCIWSTSARVEFHILGGVGKTDSVSFTRNVRDVRSILSGEGGKTKKRQAKGQQRSFQEKPNEYRYILPKAIQNTKPDKRQRYGNVDVKSSLRISCSTLTQQQ